MASLALAWSATSDSGSNNPERIQQRPDDQKILAKSIDVRLMPTHFEDLLIIAYAKGS
jgi:hypothetical protein